MLLRMVSMAFANFFRSVIDEILWALFSNSFRRSTYISIIRAVCTLILSKLIGLYSMFSPRKMDLSALFIPIKTTAFNRVTAIFIP